MQKLINEPDAFVDEVLEGILAAHPRELRRSASNPRAVLRAAAPVTGKVAIVTGGGSGHLPLFLGYVGEGLADGVAVGNVFASPSAQQFLSAAREAHAGAGVLFLIGHYGGDVMNVALAADLARAEGIDVEVVHGCDDVASAPVEDRHRRRGVAGIFFQYKAAGARAAEGGSLQEVAAAARAAGDAVRTMSVGLTPCTLPAVGEPNFVLAPGMMELGVGLHGEPGVEQAPLERVDRVADRLVDRLVDDLGLRDGDRVAVLVNGLGSTPPEELYLVYRRVHHALTGCGVLVDRVWVGDYATSLEMGGASVSLLRLDDELRRLLDAPASSPLLAL